ncbi:MAG: hypothetical protein IJF84_03705 [Thermoguttaceae bacterium]|nr:hypothetical protein [Thermoguttaceae bacterium]
MRRLSPCISYPYTLCKARSAQLSQSVSVWAFSETTRSFLSKIPIRRETGIIFPVAASYRDAKNGASPHVISNRRESTYFCHALALGNGTGFDSARHDVSY